jgi:hypothetical protein
MPDRSYREVREATLQTIALHQLPGILTRLTQSVRVLTLALLLLQGTELGGAVQLLRRLEAAVAELEADEGGAGGGERERPARAAGANGAAVHGANGLAPI